LAPQASEQSTDGFLLGGGNKLSEQGKRRQKCVRPCVAVGLFSFYRYILANKRRANLLSRIVSGFPGKQTNQSIKLIAKNISQPTFISIYSLIRCLLFNIIAKKFHVGVYFPTRSPFVDMDSSLATFLFIRFGFQVQEPVFGDINQPQWWDLSLLVSKIPLVPAIKGVSFRKLEVVRQSG
jgi:hypothetical protein